MTNMTNMTAATDSMTTDLRASTIVQLLHIRATAHADLVAATKRFQDSEWARDRMNDIMYANRELKRLGVIPETCGTDE